jgi:hypothetical protein
MAPRVRGRPLRFWANSHQVIRCPACPKDALPDTGKVQLKAEIEDLLADDEDGLAATYEDHGL